MSMYLFLGLSAIALGFLTLTQATATLRRVATAGTAPIDAAGAAPQPTRDRRRQTQKLLASTTAVLTLGTVMVIVCLLPDASAVYPGIAPTFPGAELGLVLIAGAGLPGVYRSLVMIYRLR
ncbi:hypothetical protein F8M49_21495 [Rhodococcus zopfii]|uniref:Uncharacterized protein n=1 Tax=Rhodococcus zopfii TaxID=43772 RepID=A0ABU3WTF4_9NOCA|nr:hypothetical protein [Rhodococcus zopfii]